MDPFDAPPRGGKEIQFPADQSLSSESQVVNSNHQKIQQAFFSRAPHTDDGVQGET